MISVDFLHVISLYLSNANNNNNDNSRDNTINRDDDNYFDIGTADVNLMKFLFTKETIDRLVSLHILSCSPVASLSVLLGCNITECLLFSFQLFVSALHFLILVFVCIYGKYSDNYNIWFINDFDETVMVLFDSPIIKVLLCYVGINTLIIFPITTYILIFKII